MATILKQQDYLYKLSVKHPDGNLETKVIGPIVDFLLGCDDPASGIDRMDDPETEIVSLTISPAVPSSFLKTQATIPFDLLPA